MQHSSSAILFFAAAAFGLAGWTACADEAPDPDTVAAPTVVTQVCEACHGAHGNSINAGVPSLAGQGSPYLQRQLTSFRTQRRVGVMSAVAMNLSDADILAASRYFSQQIARPGGAPSIDPAGSMLGEKIYRDGIAEKGVPSCASCHALGGEGLPPEFPSLAAQHASYLANQLHGFRSDSRISNPNAMMRIVASRLSDREIDAVAAYIAAMR